MQLDPGIPISSELASWSEILWLRPFSPLVNMEVRALQDCDSTLYNKGAACLVHREFNASGCFFGCWHVEIYYVIHRTCLPHHVEKLLLELLSAIADFAPSRAERWTMQWPSTCLLFCF
uniref:Uncharacterized protein n=1 Tax=Opuntia streptacantha TaxID=393608 RepID=A0A7C9AU29_OPUST